MKTRLSLLAYTAMSTVVAPIGIAFAQTEPESPIEQVFAALDVESIIASVVTTGVAATGIFLAYRGILFAKKLIGRYL